MSAQGQIQGNENLVVRKTEAVKPYFTRLLVEVNQANKTAAMNKDNMSTMRRETKCQLFLHCDVFSTFPVLLYYV